MDKEASPVWLLLPQLLTIAFWSTFIDRPGAGTGDLYLFFSYLLYLSKLLSNTKLTWISYKAT